jgi:hypothetical protein
MMELACPPPPCRVCVLDHHKTAAEHFREVALPDNLEIEMDMDRSGAVRV